SFEGLEVFGPAVGIAAVIHRIGPNEDISRASDLGQPQGEGEKDGIPSRYVGGWNPVPDLIGGRVLWHREFAGEGGAAKCPQVEVQDHMPANPEAFGNAASGLQLDRVPLPIPK